MLEALEVRARWLEWAQKNPRGWSNHDSQHLLPNYMRVLENGDTFFMDAKFGELVEHAARTVPDTLGFDAAWMVRPCGFLYLAEPFRVPHIEGTDDFPLSKQEMKVRAIGWQPVKPGTVIHHHQTAGRHGFEETAGNGVYQFLCYQSPLDYNMTHGYARSAFFPWSYFALRPGEQLGSKIENYEVRVAAEDPQGAYRAPLPGEHHEIRWLYAALYLMSQRLATQVRQDAPRHQRRQLERSGSPVQPFVQVVTLRRMQQAREQAATTGEREWHWQWSVRGHWRKQWYAKEGVHKDKFIEAYIKGPADKPFKEVGTKLFVAKR